MFMKKTSHIKYIRDTSGKVIDVKYTGDRYKPKSTLSPDLQKKIKLFEEKEKQQKQKIKQQKQLKMKQTWAKINKALDTIDSKKSVDTFGKKKKRSDDPMNPTGIKWM